MLVVCVTLTDHREGQSLCWLCASHSLITGRVSPCVGRVHHTHCMIIRTCLLVMLSLHMQSKSQPEGEEEQDAAEHSESEAERAVEKDSLLINKQHNK